MRNYLKAKKEINLSHSNEEELFRIERLKRVLRKINFCISICDMTIFNIYHLKDQKGTLEVYFNTEISDYYRIFIKEAWDSENETDVTYVKNSEIDNLPF